MLVSYAEAGVSHAQLMIDPNTIEAVEWASRALEFLDKA
jgi:hypothetical protein